MANKLTYKIYRAQGSTTLNEIYPSQSFHSDETVTVGKVVSSSLISGGPYRKRALFHFNWKKTTGYDKGYFQAYVANAALAQAPSLALGFNSSSLTGASYYEGRGRRDSVPPVNEGSVWGWSLYDTIPWSEPTASVQQTLILTGSLDIDVECDSLVKSINDKNNFNFAHLSFIEGFEDDSVVRGEIEYYSSKTHTIYLPTFYYASESLAKYPNISGQEIDTAGDYVIYHQNLKPIYQQASNITFRFGARNLNYSSSWSTKTTANVNKSYYLPSGSTYNFKDVSSNEFVLPESMMQALVFEADSTGHYISNIPSELFHPYRKYQLLVNVSSSDGFVNRYLLPETFMVEG